MIKPKLKADLNTSTELYNYVVSLDNFLFSILIFCWCLEYYVVSFTKL